MRKILVLLVAVIFSEVFGQEECRDLDFNCRDWVASSSKSCDSTDYIMKSCKKSCGYCGPPEKKYDLRRLAPQLQPLAFLVGKWRSEHGGKAIFPTIPKFTYGEEVDISIPDDALQAQRALNYTAFAWSINEKDELHSESGYIAVKPSTREAALTTVMNNEFKNELNNEVNLICNSGRRSDQSRDLPVHDMVREWTLLDKNTLQARLNMETLTHGMQEHTFIRYHKIAP
ncbi:hypothetical protein RB195_020819 [Necator americanus]|uniref:ShKT domain-containing protein n=1 Tax=Necator americanus TaxID=51031 RepID=A0ABR1CKP0_NECAM